MSSRLYREHFIRAFPSFDTAANGWAPQADVSWNYASTNRKCAFLKFTQRCMSEEEAIACALDMAQCWIDGRTRQPHDRIAGSTPGQVIYLMRTLQKHRPKEALKQSRPTQVSTELRPEKLLTLGEFKSAIVESGLTINEHALRKSYAALDKLRNNKHLSWNAIRQKVEQLQLDFKAARSAMRWLKAVRIPLTERDWSRIE